MAQRHKKLCTIINILTNSTGFILILFVTGGAANMIPILHFLVESLPQRSCN